jgi:hypothetical protein
MQTLPPTLQTVLGETIPHTLQDVLDGTFSEFTTKYDSVATTVVRKVKDTLAQHRESLATEYSLVQSSLQDVLARLQTLKRTNKTTPPNHPGPGGARHVSWPNSTSAASEGERIETAGTPKDDEPDEAATLQRDGDSGANAHVDPGPTNGTAVHRSP